MAFNRTTREHRTILTAEDRSDKAMSSAAANFNKMAIAVGALVGTAGLARLAGDFLDVNREFERLNASLITVTGSIESATLITSRLREFTRETPYQLEEVTQAFIKMQAMGLDPSTAALRSYGNTASAMGKSLNDMIEAVADAATGEFERLKEFGIKARSEGDRVKLTFQGVTTEIGKNSKEIVGYLRNIGEEKFGGAMQRQMDTLNGAFSNLSGSFKDLAVTIGSSGLTEALTDITNAATDTVNAVNRLVNAPDLARMEGVIDEIGRVSQRIDILSRGDNLTPMRQKRLDVLVAQREDLYTAYRDMVQTLGAARREEMAKQAALDKELLNPAGGDGGSGGGDGSTAGSGNLGGFNFYGAGLWEGSAQAGADKKNAALQAQMDFNQLRFAAEIESGQQMQDLWLTSIDSRVAAEIRGNEIIMESERDLAAQKEQVWSAVSSSFVGITNAMYTAGGKQSKKMFALNKAAGIADATINTFISANKTWAQWGYPWGIPMVAAVVASGMANVAAISSQSFGGGGSPAPAGGTGGGTATSPIVTTDQGITQPVPVAAKESRSITIIVHGNVVDQDKFARELVPSITKAINDGVA